MNVGYTQKLGSVPSTSASTNRGSDTRLIVARASARGAAAARGRVERRIGHLSVVERGLRRSAAARAWVLIAATWRGDGVASALACGHALLGSGGGSIDGGGSADLLRKRCCSAGSCCSRRASDSWGHLRKAAAGVDDVALGWLSEGESAVFKAVLRARAVARQACAQG